ncbi:hypothetical protein F5Y10DRAFT_236932 [Nemania abortiva]|nr:hypothetical protein F5Y10DRAFT_236932 [Nemania abortiva]
MTGLGLAPSVKVGWLVGWSVYCSCLVVSRWFFWVSGPHHIIRDHVILQPMYVRWVSICALSACITSNYSPTYLLTTNTHTYLHKVPA